MDDMVSTWATTSVGWRRVVALQPLPVFQAIANLLLDNSPVSKYSEVHHAACSHKRLIRVKVG